MVIRRYLATGLVTMAALPPYLLWRGVPSAIEAAAFASLLLPVIAAVLLIGVAESVAGKNKTRV